MRRNLSGTRICCRAKCEKESVRLRPLAWPAALPDGPALFSLRPENIRLAAGTRRCQATVRVRGSVRHQAFHGATELIRVECADGLVLVVRTPAAADCSGDVELEFSSVGLRFSVREISGKNLMFSRAYKAAVTLPPLMWVTVFLLVPYLLMFCYSFWSVSASQTIVHSWNLANYRQLL